MKEPLDIIETKYNDTEITVIASAISKHSSINRYRVEFEYKGHDIKDTYNYDESWDSLMETYCMIFDS